MLLIDDYSRMMWVTILREKYKALEKLNIFKAMLEIEIGLKLKCLRYGRGGEFTSGEFNAFFEEHGVKRQLSAPRTPHHNGFVERMNKIVQEIVRTMMIERNVLHVYWREVVSIVFYTLNRVNIKGDTSKTPYELWFGHVPTIRYFLIF
jgi:transposase InsO family protein